HVLVDSLHLPRRSLTRSSLPVCCPLHPHSFPTRRSSDLPDFSFDTFHKLAEVFSLDTKARLNGFSKGMQRQAEIVLGFATQPDFMLFDETFDGLDPAKRALIKDLTHEYMQEEQASIIVSSHDLHEVEG